MHQTLLLWKSRSPKGICKRKRERGWWEAFLPLLFCRPPSSWKRPKCRWLFPSSFRTYVAKLLSGSKLVTLIIFQHARWWTDKSWRRCEAFSCLENHQKVIRNTRCHLLLPSPQKFLFLDAEEEAGFLLCTGAANQLLMWPLFLFFATAAKCLLGPYRIVCTLYLRRHQWRTFWESFTLYRLWKRLLLPVFNFLKKSYWMFHLSEYIL